MHASVSLRVNMSHYLKNLRRILVPVFFYYLVVEFKLGAGAGRLGPQSQVTGEHGLGLAEFVQVETAFGQQVAAFGQFELALFQHVIDPERLLTRTVVAQCQQVQRFLGFVLNTKTG